MVYGILWTWSSFPHAMTLLVLIAWVSAIALSIDHKPNRSDERQRIEKAGGVVMWSGEHLMLYSFSPSVLFVRSQRHVINLLRMVSKCLMCQTIRFFFQLLYWVIPRLFYTVWWAAQSFSKVSFSIVLFYFISFIYFIYLFEEHCLSDKFDYAGTWRVSRRLAGVRAFGDRWWKNMLCRTRNQVSHTLWPLRTIIYLDFQKFLSGMYWWR